MQKRDKDGKKKKKEKCISDRWKKEKKREKNGIREKAAHAHVSETYTYEYLQVSFHEVYSEDLPRIGLLFFFS